MSKGRVISDIHIKVYEDGSWDKVEVVPRARDNKGRFCHIVPNNDSQAEFDFQGGNNEHQ